MLTLLLALAQAPSLPAQSPIAPRRWSRRVNFQSETAAVPPGYLRDFGEPYGPRPGQGFGLVYGWSEPGGGPPIDLTGLGRERGLDADPRLDTLMHMHHPGNGQPGPGVWEIALEPGDYAVRIACGDPEYLDSVHRVIVEGLVAIDGFQPTAQADHVEAFVTVSVRDGRLTLDSSGGDNTKINYVEITRGAPARPSISSVNPADGATGVALDAFVSTDVYLPHAGLDAATVGTNSVRLYPAAAPGNIVSAVVNTTGGGDAIVLDPLGELAPDTNYVFEVTDDVRDTAGGRLVPFTSTFRTATDGGGGTSVSADLVFDRQTVATSADYTSLEVGPDGKLYALVSDGAIHRFTIEPDGSLSNLEPIFSLMAAEGGARLAIGLAHDPASTPAQPIVWVSHTTFGFHGMPDWGGKISRLTGPALDVVETVVTGLPRSARDHVTNGLDFGPDGALYFVQGSNSAMGAPDTAWSNRDERLLSAAVLRLDTQALGALPLDVQTSDGGTYDPFDGAAPLTIWASGVRNAYDLVWHSSGSLFVPTNGSAAGGNAPPSPDPLPGSCATRIDGVYTGPDVPGVGGVSVVQHDFLFHVVEGGYYGHPNPARCEWVLNGGNPTASTDPAEVAQYPVGTLPDPNWRGFAFDFENNKSPNGVVELSGKRFGGALDGALLVARYSGGDDLMVLVPDANGAIVATIDDVATLDSMNDPLDVAVDPATGNLYVSEYGNGTLTLVRPRDGTIEGSSFSPHEVVASGVRGTVSEAHAVTLTNESTVPLEVTAAGIAGANSSDFAFVSLPTFPQTLAAGEELTVEVAFTPDVNTVGPLEATLGFATDRGIGAIRLFGLSAQALEGSGEPPLARVVDSLGVAIDVGGDQLSLGTNPAAIGDERLVPLFVKAGPGDVTMEPVARYSPAFELPFGLYEPNGTSPTLHTVGTLAGSASGPEHQTLHPELASGGVTFDPGAAVFGCFTTSPSHTAFTEDSLNAALFPSYTEHAVRVYPVVHRRGVPVPDTWLVCFEEASNGDYQDYVFVLRNARRAP